MLLKKACATAATTSCLCVALASGAACADDGKPAIWNKWGAWAELGAYAANHSDATRAEGTLWAPLLQGRDSLLFTDIRGKFFDEDQQEGNAAIGYRKMMANGWNFGIWTGFDRRHTSSGPTFNQASLGLEALSADWDFRVNGYVPTDKVKLASSTDTGPAWQTVDIYNGGLYLLSGPSTRIDINEHAFRGFDAEVGWRVPLERWFGPDSSTVSFRDLRVYAGGYYFENDTFPDDIAGPRARAEWRIKNVIAALPDSRLTLEASWQYDDVRSHQVEAGARLRIPLGGDSASASRALAAQEERMTEGLKRDTNIVTQTKFTTTVTQLAPELVEDALTGVPFITALIVSRGNRQYAIAGSTPQSLDQLQAAINAAGSNAIIILSGGEFLTDLEMLPNQTLLGSGGTVAVRGVNTGTLATYTAPLTPGANILTLPTHTPAFPDRTRTVLVGTSEGPTVTTANNTHIAGLDIFTGNQNNISVLVGANQRVFIDHVNIEAQTEDGAAIIMDGSNSSLTLRDSAIYNSTFGIHVNEADNINLVVERNIFSMLQNALEFHGTNINLTLANNTFGQAIDYYLFFNDNSTAALQNSTGNIDGIPATDYCFAPDFNRFTGSFSFTNGVSKSNLDCDHRD